MEVFSRAIKGPIAPAERVQEEEQLLLLDRSGLLSLHAEPECNRWTGDVVRDLRVSIAACALFGADRTLIKSIATADGSPSDPVELGSGEPVEQFLREQIRALSPDVEACSYLEVPIEVDGRVVGVVGAAERGAREFSDRDRSDLEQSAAAVAVEIALRLSRSENTQFRELINSHNTVHDLIARAAPLTDVLGEIVRSIERQDPSLLPAVVLLDSDTSTLHPGAGASLPADYLQAIDGVVIGPNVGTCGSAAWWGRLMITEDIAVDPRWAPVRTLATGFGLRHCWSIPINAPGGVVLGTLAFYGREPRLPTNAHVNMMSDWARVAGIAIERHHVLERLTHDARFDALTGLPNRAAIFEKLEKTIQRAQAGSQVAVMFIDLDGLKELNDTLGHDRADDMLREIAERLSANCENHFVGRMGGDEFIVVAEDIADADDVGELGMRLLGCISEPLPGLDPAAVTASIGITLIDTPSVDGREAIRQADSAMYEAKNAGRDRCAFYQGRQPVRPGRRLLLARELSGIERSGELAIEFQPVLAVDTEKIVAVEALLRWHSPSFGTVSPGEFIPIAEDTGAIAAIGAWVLRESCETIARITDELGRPLELAVNVSAHQVANPGFALWVQRTISHAEFPAELLTLEITETALMRPDAVTARTLRDLDELGVQLVLDDFGTGFSSLSWLKIHPLHAIKIDRSFITGLAEDPRDQAIVASVISMGRELGCMVTAEGVETAAQLAALRDLRCERAQGFLLARPQPERELVGLLSQGGAAKAA